MPKTNTIARAEIADLLGTSLAKLLNIINNSNAELPAPFGREGRRLVYDRKIIMDWIATNPLENITWKQFPKKAAANEQIDDHARAFISGRLGVSKAQRQHQQLRKIAAKHAQRSTQRVEVDGCDDYHGSRGTIAGRV